MLFKIFVLLFLWFSDCLAVIYRLNETQFQQMPALYSMDDYESCLSERGALYCVLDGDLFSSDNSTLIDLIHEYTEDTTKHFNHTQIHRALCVTNTCRKFMENHDINKTEDLNIVLSKCINHTVFKKYKIESKLAKVHYCNSDRSRLNVDTSDIIVAVVYLALIALNITGTLYDVLKFDKTDDSGNPYLLSFSIRRNWYKLTRPSGGPDPRINRLKLFNGLRSMTMVCVFFSHTTLVMAISYVDNPLYIEKSYDDPLKQILYNGSLVTFTFFVMSSFLLAYNFELHAEKHQISWLQFPKGMLLRWLRLTPTYALVLATISTWMRHFGSGPLWDLVVTSEATACRRYWWAHLLYINNYIYDDALCAPQTWYLASDTQMFAAGLLLCVMVRKRKARIVALVVLFIASLAVTAAHTYFQDLEAVVIQAPESYRSLYARDDTFRLLYTRGHTTFSVYVLGLAAGFLTYYWQNEGANIKKIKKHRWAYWLLFPLGLAVILSGGFFYMDSGRASAPVRVLYATFYKPIFQLLVIIFIIGGIFKIESVYRGIVEWRGFTWTGRVSYSAFLLHTLFQRGFVGSQTRPIHMSDYYVMTVLTSTIFLSFISAGMLWVCVEGPLVSVTKALLSSRKRIEQTKV